ncbi:MAG: class I SAM-dependent methyltransferase [Actinomycetota bacterium]|nr:class I SAM-dependent methyltransferase [Actinomycetota bacterium]
MRVLGSTLGASPWHWQNRMLAKLEQCLPDRELMAISECFAGAQALEIGGPSPLLTARGPIPVYPRLRSLDLVNFAQTTLWDSVGSDGIVPRRSLVAEAVALGVEDCAYDAVLASHVIEHLADPVSALREWSRATKPGGALLVVVPHKDGTFDHRRPATTIEHLLEDAEKRMPETDLSHLDEILRLHDRLLDPQAGSAEQFAARSRDNARHRALHHHVFVSRTVGLMCEAAGLEVERLTARRPFHIVCLARRPSVSPPSLRWPARARPSPFPSDRWGRRYPRSIVSDAYYPPTLTKSANGRLAASFWRLVRASSRPVRHATLSIAFATRVNQSGKFLAAQATRDPSRIRHYTLRGSGVSVFIRHGTGDVGAFDEVIFEEVYELPLAVKAVLRALDGPLALADLGANIGLFTAYMLAKLALRSVVAFEPDPVNAALLERCAEANRDRARWRLERACASNRNGEVPFLGGRFAESRIATAQETTVRVPMLDVMHILVDVDMLKIDIEGGEWPILSDSRMKQVGARVVVLEYHPRGCPGEDPEAQATMLLDRAGFRVVESLHAGPADHGLLWAIRA